MKKTTLVGCGVLLFLITAIGLGLWWMARSTEHHLPGDERNNTEQIEQANGYSIGDEIGSGLDDN